MVDHEIVQLALRARLLTLVVCTTGATSLSATATGYARVAGSFLTDGFAVGMELVGAAFGIAGNNAAKTITGVTALTITAPSCTAEAAAAGRTLSVRLPASFVLENSQTFKPTAGIPYADEQYIPGPAGLTTIGPRGRLVAEPQYSPSIHVPAGTGVIAVRRYHTAVLALFPSGLVIVLSNGDSLRVRADVGPFVGQLQNSAPGFAVVPATIPLRVYSLNSI